MNELQRLAIRRKYKKRTGKDPKWKNGWLKGEYAEYLELKVWELENKLKRGEDSK